MKYLHTRYRFKSNKEGMGSLDSEGRVTLVSGSSL